VLSAFARVEPERDASSVRMKSPATFAGRKLLKNCPTK